jgi:hypothetical protein
MADSLKLFDVKVFHTPGRGRTNDSSYAGRIVSDCEYRAASDVKDGLNDFFTEHGLKFTAVCEESL